MNAVAIIDFRSASASAARPASSVVAGLRLDDRPYLPHRFVMLDDGPAVGPGGRDLGF